MDELHIFVSVGVTATESQENFVRAIEQRLQSEGFIPHTVGRNTFDYISPLETVMSLMDTCSGAVVIAFERLYFPAGRERRGGKNETQLSEVKLPTCWNQIEAAMAYCRNLPLLVMVERGLKREGLLDQGNGWYIQWVDVDPAALSTSEFNGVLAGWKQKVNQIKSAQAISKHSQADDDVDKWTIREFIERMKPAQLWGVLAALAAGAFALGAKFLGSAK